MDNHDKLCVRFEMEDGGYNGFAASYMGMDCVEYVIAAPTKSGLADVIDSLGYDYDDGKSKPVRITKREKTI